MRQEIALLKDRIRSLEEEIVSLRGISGRDLLEETDKAEYFSERDKSLRNDLSELTNANLELQREIVARQRVEDLLAESEERYRLLFNNSNDMIFLHWLAHENFLGEPLEVNETGCRVLGYSKDELLMAATKLIPDEMIKVLSDARKSLLREKKVMFRITMLTKKGSPLEVEFNSNLFDLAGQPTILSVVRDITSRST